ncbi:MAG: hypothetical protein FWK04_29555 [Nostoc sp. GBBB01]|nr:hypothetical protein [Nostoc sp. GBBB01]
MVISGRLSQPHFQMLKKAYEKVKQYSKQVTPQSP